MYGRVKRSSLHGSQGERVGSTLHELPFKTPGEDHFKIDDAVNSFFSSSTVVTARSSPKRKGRLAKMLAAHQAPSSIPLPPTPTEPNTTGCKNLKNSVTSVKVTEEERVKLLAGSIVAPVCTTTPDRDFMLCYQTSHKSAERLQSRVRGIASSVSSDTGPSEDVGIDEGLESSSGEEESKNLLKIKTLTELSETGINAIFAEELEVIASVVASQDSAALAVSLSELCERFPREDFAMKLRMYDYIPKFFYTLARAFDQAATSKFSKVIKLCVLCLVHHLLQDRRNVSILVTDSLSSFCSTTFKFFAYFDSNSGEKSPASCLLERQGALFSSAAKQRTRSKHLLKPVNELCNAMFPSARELDKVLNVGQILTLQLCSSVCKWIQKAGYDLCLASEPVLNSSQASNVPVFYLPSSVFSSARQQLQQVALAQSAKEISSETVALALELLNELFDVLWMAEGVANDLVCDAVAQWADIYRSNAAHCRKIDLVASNSLLSASHFHPATVRSHLASKCFINIMVRSLAQFSESQHRFVTVGLLVCLAEQEPPSMALVKVVLHSSAVQRDLLDMLSSCNVETSTESNSLSTCISYFLAKLWQSCSLHALDIPFKDALISSKSLISANLSSSLESQLQLYRAQLEGKQCNSHIQARIQRQAKSSIDNFSSVLKFLQTLS